MRYVEFVPIIDRCDYLSSVHLIFQPFAICIHNTYQFTMGATGDKVKARYTYNYVKEDGIWKIQHPHSSVMPEEIAMGKAITEDEVRSLFSLWNNALATLDPVKVAKRYAKAGVLLPTVSDVPRTDFSSIEDYFVNFLKLKPQGEILESHVTIGHNWCQDAGISMSSQWAPMVPR